MAFSEAEARDILRRELDAWRRLSWTVLRESVGTIATPEVEGASGVRYQVEIEPVWDSAPGGVIRVLAGIDDGGLRAFSPITDDFLVAPDG